jgi:UDP-glucose:O-linked fucose beta-1,3-glucosyltransferase
MDLPEELAEMGLPFANQINKKLQTEVASKELEIKSLQSRIEDHGERIQALKEHRQNVLQELQQSQALYDARKRDLETEDHLKQIAEREDGRLSGAIKQAKSELGNIKEQMNVYENNMYRILQEIDVLKTQMKMDQTTLNAYLEKSAERDEDAMIIQKYARQDESKIKDLTLKIESLQDSLMRNRRELDKERMETVSAQVCLQLCKRRLSEQELYLTSPL